MNLRAWFHIYIHHSFSYNHPTVGKRLTWDCECIKCGAKFTVSRPNTPQWRSPVLRDKTAEKTWDEWENNHMFRN